MATVTSSVAEVCRAAKRAAGALAQIDTDTKDRALEAIAVALQARVEEILAANARDMQTGVEADLGAALLDRLRLDEARVAGIASAVRDIAALADPVGEVISGARLPNGLDVRKVRVPLGVVAVVYEARPNVTVDAAALCLKSGNAIVLRGSSSASHSNAALAQIAADAAVAAGLPQGSVTLLAGGGHEELAELATQDDSVDLIIPRGGERLKEALQAVATVPVMYAASGNCHVYVDASADLDQAEAIVINAKTQRPGVCNALECLLVDERIAPTALPRLAFALREAGVELRCDERALPLAAGGVAAMADDFGREFLDLKLAVAVVDGIDGALRHIARYGSRHTEAIVTKDPQIANRFMSEVDASCVLWNASTRFNDGGELGLGAEIGISTSKLHAYGPMGLRELTCTRYVVRGDGQVRT